jgi:mono/diheme cytochrome c family protein
MRKLGARHGWWLGMAALGALGCSGVAPQKEGRASVARVVPLDERPAVTPAQRALPISGGTLHILQDGSAAIAADPERDMVSVIDLASFSLRHTVALQPGDQPGRITEDAERRVHVVLRGAGAVASIDPLTGAVTNRRAVCRSPRGIAFESVSGLLHVACAEGALVSLPAAAGEVTRSLQLDTDLRDVMVRGAELWVTRFKSAELLRVDGLGIVTARQALHGNPDPAPVDLTVKQVARKEGVAYRAAPTANGGAVVVHQLAQLDPVDVSGRSTGQTPQTAHNSGAYSGGATCDGLVRNVVSVVPTSGEVLTTAFQSSPLPVDIAVSPNQQAVAVAHAGPVEPGLPRPYVEFTDSSGFTLREPSFSGGSGISVLPISSTHTPCVAPNRNVFEEPVTAVAFAPDGKLYAQTREPPRLLLLPVDSQSTPQLPGPATLQVLALPGESRLDSGHELFNRDAGGGIACASCHPEGAEDGHVWTFSDTGARRTQALNIGLSGTAPFHWAGDLPDVTTIMSQIFVDRMGGNRQVPARSDALGSWLFSLSRPLAVRDVNDPAAQRGRALFESAAVGCASCHGGEKLTNNETVAIDTAREALQVPSLVAIGHRAPFMHDGCATTLGGRFDPLCGGNAHGNTAGLAPEQLADLVAYLEAL